MKFSILDDNTFRFPFRSRRLVLTALFFLLAAAAFVRADADIPQTETDARQLVRLAQKQVRKGNLGEAEKILRRAVEIDPAHSAARLHLAYILLKQRQLVEAYDLSFRVAQEEPKNSYAFAVLGATLLGAGNFRDASTLFYNALTLNRREALAWCGLGMFDFYENRINEALDSLHNAVYLDPDEPDFVLALAQVSARAERYTDAADAYHRFLEISPQTDKERRDRIKGLIRFLRFLGGKPALYDLGGGEQTSVSFDLLRDRPVIQVRVNRKEEPLRFVLDTGSGMSVISHKTAERLKIKPVTRGGLARAIGGSGKFEIVYGFLKSVQVGEVEIRNVPVYIREFHANSERIDGYIGLSLISKYLTVLDYGQQTFSLFKRGADDGPETANKSLFLPLRMTSSGFLSGEVHLEGIENPLNFIVDTGASVSVISDELAGMSEISRFERPERMRVVGAAGITEDVPSFLLPRVTFGSHSRESIMAIALNLNLINEASGFQQAGILGGNFLKNYRLTFDFKNSKVIFTPVEK